jgi:hypothetical protein
MGDAWQRHAISRNRCLFLNCPITISIVGQHVTEKIKFLPFSELFLLCYKIGPFLSVPQFIILPCVILHSVERIKLYYLIIIMPLGKFDITVHAGAACFKLLVQLHTVPPQINETSESW